MKTIIKIITAITMGVMAAGCVNMWPRYVTRGGKVYFRDFSDGSNPFVKANTEVVGTDRRTFKVFKTSSNFMEGRRWAMDKNRVYHSGDVVAGADVDTFLPIDSHYAVDKNHVFAYNKIFEGADPATFHVLDDDYALDADSVWFRDEALVGTIAGADSETFEILGYLYAKDKNAVYYKGTVLPEVSDPATFRLLGEPERESRTVADFFRDVAATEDSWHEWACDKDYYYRDGRRVEGADRATFTFFDDNGKTDYAKDRAHVFYCGHPRPFLIEGADVETFEVLSHNWVARDKNNYYYNGKVNSYEELVKARMIRTVDQR
ncbi:MAG: DKNYY domain-containing protein [Alistipes sp.]|nr:DKNYY domain-containing protein [Alistipes sp.]